jgi:hypothetical protein
MSQQQIRRTGDRKRWPLMVRLTLWRLHDRNAAWMFVWLCAIFACMCIAYGFVNPWLFIGSPLAIAAIGYYFAIKWVDRNGRWY